ncbi:MAG: glycosyltransferase family 39 protein [Patescibacteria group bacterium]|nr:glycosyltransferase family 39 protein [Patescibacteria group bacterium]
MKKGLVPLIGFLGFFFVIKVLNIGVRLSDTNIYFNDVYQIFQGKLLYRDIFFSNFPFFSYISSLYYLLTNKNIEIFYITSAIEVMIITTLIYFITYKKTKDILLSLTSSALYIFSFIVLSTSDHQTGVFTASLFAVLGFLFLQEKKYFLSGVFMALSFLTKAYYIPIAFSFFVYLILQKNYKKIFNFSIAFIVTGFIVVLPFLIFAPKEFFGDIFGFSLSRPSGIMKNEVAWFFISKDFLLFMILIFNLLDIRKSTFFALVSISSIIFFFGFQDVYYLYLNFLVPFLCLSFYEFYNFLTKKLNFKRPIILFIVSIFILINISVYFSGYRNLQKVENFEKIVQLIRKENPDYLYGVNDITPALLYVTKIPPLQGVTDAHEYFFTKKILDKEFLTKKAVQKKTIIISHGVSYPQISIEEKVIDEIFNKDLVLKSCKLLESFPVKAEGVTNRINLFKCY